MEEQIYMTPKQPFFVTASETYEKYVMNRLGIVHFYHCITGTSPNRSSLAIPDGCVDMLFCCDPIFPYAEICGTVLSAEISVMQPNTCYFGVRFLPGYNPILGDSGIMEELVQHRIPFDTLIQDQRMLEGICGTQDFRKQIDVFMRSYMSIYRRVNPMEHASLLVQHTANLLIRSSGKITVEEIAEDTGYTVRYISKSFRTGTGLSPKQFARIVRFQTAISALNDPMGRSLTEISADLGYYDQSHFVREFKDYTGLTPKNYQHQLENDQFHEKLNIVL